MNDKKKKGVKKTEEVKTEKTKIKSFMKLISAIKIFVAILFLISPIDILCEKIDYSLQLLI